MTRHTKNRNVTLLVQYKQVIKFNVGQYRVLISHMRGLSPILRKREKEKEKKIDIYKRKAQVSDRKKKFLSVS